MDDLDRAILKVRETIIPKVEEVDVTPDKPYKRLYNILQIFDHPDTITDEKVEFIHNYLMENGGNPRDQITQIHSRLGSLSTDSLVSRVHKHCKLREQSSKLLNRYENLQRDINAL